METSSNKKIVIGILVALALVLVGYGFYRSMNPSLPDLTPPPEEQVPPTRDYPEEIINAKHQYKNGVHTYGGEFELPTPCDTLSYDVVKDVANPSNVELNFKTVPSSTVCAQVLTPKSFKVSFEGPEKIALTVTRDGKSVKFNLFEVPVNQDFDSFTLQIKG
jgi:hypothetical protein